MPGTGRILRFSDRVENYVRYRPGYPLAVLRLLERECALTPASIVADIGSGTGLLARLFCENGNRVFGVEPNQPMRAAGEQWLQGYTNFTTVVGTAEATTLPHQNVDFITAAQSFHWFDRGRARLEFQRILRPAGWVVLVWNSRRLTSTPFLAAYENLLLDFGTDYKQVRHEIVEANIASFFGSSSFRHARFDNYQLLDYEGIKGRLLSSSYVPNEKHPRYQRMLEELQRVFDRHADQGRVRVEYDTKMYYGRLS